MPRKKTTLADLLPDPHNARLHSPAGIGLIVDALHEVGAGRSIVIDEANVVLAGNGVLEAAAEAGIMDVRIVEAAGDELIAVRRRGLTAAQKVRLALFDNRAAERSTWNADVLLPLAEKVDLSFAFNAEDFAVATNIIVPPEAPTEFQSVGEDVPTDYRCPGCGLEWSGDPKPAVDKADQ